MRDEGDAVGVGVNNGYFNGVARGEAPLEVVLNRRS